MRIWADVVDVLDQSIEGPVLLSSATVTRRMDGAGEISIKLPLSEERGNRLVQEETRVRVYVDFRGTIRQVGAGLITSVTRDPMSGSLEATGPDLLFELSRASTLTNLQLSGTVTSIVNQLASLAGWSASVAGVDDERTLRFDGESALSAILSTVRLFGLSSRQVSTLERLIEVGPLGDVQDVLLTNPILFTTELTDNLSVFPISQLSITAQSEALANWVLPLGQGLGETPLTLEHSTRGSVLSTLSPSGETVYYVRDQASVDTYGEIRTVRSFREIAPLDGTSAELERAANALCDSTLAWLDRYSQPQTAYRATLLQPRVSLTPGDRVRLRYVGLAKTSSGVSSVDIDETVWVVSVQESFGDQYGQVVELSTIDQLPRTDSSQVASTVQSSKWAERELMRGRPSDSGLVLVDNEGDEISVSPGQPLEVVGNDGIESIVTDSPATLSLGLTDGGVNGTKLTDSTVSLSKLASGVAGRVIGYDGSGNPIALQLQVTTIEEPIWRLVHHEILVATGEFDLDLAAMSDYSAALELEIMLVASSDVAANRDGAYIICNTDTTLTNYYSQDITANAAVISTGWANDPTIGFTPGSTGLDSWGTMVIRIPNFRDTSKLKSILVNYSSPRSSTIITEGQNTVVWSNSAAINRIRLRPDGFGTDEFIVGSQVLVKFLLPTTVVTGISLV